MISIKYLIIIIILILLILNILYIQTKNEYFVSNIEYSNIGQDSIDQERMNTADYVYNYNANNKFNLKHDTCIKKTSDLKTEPVKIISSTGNTISEPQSTDIINTTNTTNNIIIPTNTANNTISTNNPALAINDNSNIIIENTSVTMMNLYLFGTYIENYLNIPLSKIDTVFSKIYYNNIINFYHSMEHMLFNLYCMLTYSGYDLSIFNANGIVPLNTLTANALLNDLNNVNLPIIDYGATGSSNATTMPPIQSSGNLILQEPVSGSGFSFNLPLKMEDASSKILKFKIIKLPLIKKSLSHIGKENEGCVYSNDGNTKNNDIIPKGTSITTSNLATLYNIFVNYLKEPADTYIQKFLTMYLINQNITAYNAQRANYFDNNNGVNYNNNFTRMPLLDYQKLIYSDNNVYTDDFNNFISNMRVGFNLIKTYYINISSKTNYVIQYSPTKTY